MSQPRNPSPNPVPQPDPAGIADYAAAVLGIPLTDWQRQSLTDAVIGFGYAVIASGEGDEEDEEPAELDEAKADVMQRLSPRRPDPEQPQRLYAPTRIPPSQTPIGDGLGSPATDPRNT